MGVCGVPSYAEDSIVPAPKGSLDGSGSSGDATRYHGLGGYENSIVEVCYVQLRPATRSESMGADLIWSGYGQVFMSQKC